MKIIIDCMGGDNAPLEILKGVIDAKAELGGDYLLVGHKEQMEKVARENGKGRQEYEKDARRAGRRGKSYASEKEETGKNSLPRRRGGNREKHDRPRIRARHHHHRHRSSSRSRDPSPPRRSRFDESKPSSSAPPHHFGRVEKLRSEDISNKRDNSNDYSSVFIDLCILY